MSRIQLKFENCPKIPFEMKKKEREKTRKCREES